MLPSLRENNSPVVFGINEIFYSIQGEGFYAGCPAVFIRLHGCNLDCSWCDTNHSLQKGYMSPEEIIFEISKATAAVPAEQKNDFMIILTGGEPTIWDYEALARDLGGAFPLNMLAMETNGTHSASLKMRQVREDLALDWVTVSPKLSEEDCEEYFADNNWRGDELKVVLSPGLDKERIAKLPLELKDRFSAFYIQPCSEANEEAIDFVKENPQWKLSLQTQKMINIR